MNPLISPEITALAPGFRALSITLKVKNPNPLPLPESFLFEACQTVINTPKSYTQTHTEAWNEVFKNFGAKPKKTPSSFIALTKRILKNQILPKINPVVDLHNSVSVLYALPVGGENASAYAGNPILCRALGDEPFDCVKEGNETIEFPEQGEVIWRDNVGVTCRIWNWRQGIRTRINGSESSMWFILESLPAMPQSALQEAGDFFTDHLLKLYPDAEINSVLCRTE